MSAGSLSSRLRRVFISPAMAAQNISQASVPAPTDQVKGAFLRSASGRLIRATLPVNLFINISVLSFPDDRACIFHTTGRQNTAPLRQLQIQGRAGQGSTGALPGSP